MRRSRSGQIYHKFQFFFKILAILEQYKQVEQLKEDNLHAFKRSWVENASIKRFNVVSPWFWYLLLSYIHIDGGFKWRLIKRIPVMSLTKMPTRTSLHVYDENQTSCLHQLNPATTRLHCPFVKMLSFCADVMALISWICYPWWKIPLPTFTVGIWQWLCKCILF